MQKLKLKTGLTLTAILPCLGLIHYCVKLRMNIGNFTVGRRVYFQ